MRKLLFFYLLPLCVFSCVNANNTPVKLTENTEFSKKWRDTVSIENIDENPSFYDGEKVLVKGKIIGWKECLKSARTTRSDVVIVDVDKFTNARYCLYIKGGINPKFWDKEVVLKGTIRTRNGKPYLDEAEVIDEK